MIEKAIYQPHISASLNGNPLTEAIPVITDKSLFLEKLTQVPTFSTNLWELPDVYQQVELRKLDQLYIPSPIAYSLYNRFCSLILHGYSQYNPISAETVNYQFQIALKAKEGNYQLNGCSSRTTAPSLLAFGHSGVGKTMTIRTVLSIIPQAIRHELFGGQVFRQDQLVWVSFDLPSTASLKGLALNFFAAVDKALGTDYYDKWKDKSHRTVERHLGQIQLIAITHHLGLVHIDELQFMLKYGKSKDAPSFIAIEALFNKLGIPIVLSCTSVGRDMLLSGKNSPDFTTTRRILNDREYRFSLCGIESHFFADMFKVLFADELCTESGHPDDEFRNLFYFYTCGLPAIMTRLAFLHHDTILQLRSKKPNDAEQYQTNDIARLKKVYEGQFSLIARALKLLRAGNVDNFEATVEKNDIGAMCITDKDVKQKKEKHRKKVAKSVTINSQTPLGIPEPIMPVRGEQVSSFLEGDEQ